MKTLAIVGKDLKSILRDRQALSVMIAQPMVIILVLGLALGPLFLKGSGPLEGDIGVVCLDEDELTLALLEDFLDSPQLAQALTQIDLKTEDEARALVASGRLKVAIVVPEGFSANMLTGTKANLKLLYDPTSVHFAPMVRGLVGDFADQISTRQIATTAVMSQWLSSIQADVAQHTILPESPSPIWPDNSEAGITELASRATQAVAERMEAYGPAVAVTSMPTTNGVSSFDYYAAGMGVMYLLFAMMLGARSLLDERDDFTLARLMSTPTYNRQILAGKLLSVAAIGVIEWVILVVFTRLVYGVKWGQSPVAFLALSASTIIACAGVSIFLATTSKTRRGVSAISSITIQVMSLLGGSMVPYFLFPRFMLFLSRLTPNYWAMNGFVQLFTGSGLTDIIPNVLALTGIGITLFTIGNKRLRLD